MYVNADKSIKIISGRNIVESSFSTILTLPPLLTLFKTFPPNFILPRQKKLFSLIQRIPEKNNDLIFKMGGNVFLKILTPLSTHL